jgi:hypothetical protein
MNWNLPAPRANGVEEAPSSPRMRAVSPPERGQASPQAGEENQRGPDFAELTGGFGWRRLHPEIRLRFSGNRDAVEVTYPGTMDIELSWVGVIFALAAKLFGGPLPLRGAKDAGAIVSVRSDGQGGVIWERWLALAKDGPPLCIRSTKMVDAQGRLLECVDGGLGMVLRVFEQDHALVFQSQSYFLQVAGRKWTLPQWLTPGVCRVEHSHVGPGMFRFTMSVQHPMFGRTAHQTGVFSDPTR